MFGFIGKALSSLVLDKKARKVLSKSGKTGRGAAIAEAQARMNEVMTPERAELIRQAMAVRKAKQTVLADLSDADRQKLVAAAMKRLLNEDGGKG